MSEENRATVRRIFDEILNQGQLAVADEIIAADFVEHHPRPGQGPGRTGFKHRASMLRTAFPDLRYVVEDEIAAGDKVVVRVSASGTHRGELAGIAPTGRTFRMSGIVIFRLADGRIVERWASYDNLSMLQQLGAVLGWGKQERRGWGAALRAPFRASA